MKLSSIKPNSSFKTKLINMQNCATQSWNFSPEIEFFSSLHISILHIFPSWNRIRWQTFYITDQWFWSPDVWHKILEGRWKSKTCLYKKSFTKYWVVACILNLLVHRKYTLSLLWDENFFHWIGPMGIKKSVFLCWFINFTIFGEKVFITQKGQWMLFENFNCQKYKKRKTVFKNRS